MIFTRKQCLLLSFAAASLFFILILLFMPVQFQTNDDPTILSYMAGYRTGIPSAHELGFTTIGLGFIVSRLYMLLPMFPWYTLVHMLALWLSASAVCFCILDSGRTTKRAFWISSVCTLCFLASIYLYASTMLQFTTTPAMAAGAAIVLLLHYKNGGRRYFIFSLVMMALLMGFCYSMRPSTFYICSALFVCVAVVKFIACVDRRRHIALLVVVPLAVAALLYLINAVKYSTPEYKAFIEYNQARSEVMDYPRPSFDEAPDVYENAGLSKVESNYINQWYFLLDKANTTMFMKLKAGIDEYYRNNPEKYPGSDKGAVERYSVQIRASKYHTFCFWLILSLTCVIVLTPAYAKPAMKDTVSDSPVLRFFVRNGFQIIAIGIFVFFCLSNVYFTELGRYPERVYYVIILVSAPPLFLLAVKTIQNRNFPQARPFAIWSVTLLIVINVLSVSSIDIPALKARKSSVEPPYLRAYEYAIDNPGNIYFNNISGGSALNPFAAFPGTKPTNWIQVNGGALYSPLYYKQLALNGFYSASQDLLLDSRAYYMTKGLAAPIVEYYKMCFPEYEFVLVDEIGSGIKVYKLMQVKG